MTDSVAFAYLLDSVCLGLLDPGFGAGANYTLAAQLLSVGPTDRCGRSDPCPALSLCSLGPGGVPRQGVLSSVIFFLCPLLPGLFVLRLSSLASCAFSSLPCFLLFLPGLPC